MKSEGREALNGLRERDVRTEAERRRVLGQYFNGLLHGGVDEVRGAIAAARMDIIPLDKVRELLAGRFHSAAVGFTPRNEAEVAIHASWRTAASDLIEGREATLNFNTPKGVESVVVPFKAEQL